MPTSIVVTGASGFIGSKLVKCLRKILGFKVYAISKSIKNSDFVYVKSFLELPKSDIIIHLGQNSNRSMVNKKKDLVKEALDDLDMIISKKFKQIVFCSSSSVYGDKGLQPYKENAFVYEYDNYSSMKIKSEKKVINASGCVLRLSNVIGKEMSQNTVLMEIVNHLGLEKELILKDGNPIRDFISLDYVIKVMIKVIELNCSGIYNVGSNNGISIKQLTGLVLNEANEPNRTFSFKEKRLKYSYNVLNTSKLKNLLGKENLFSIKNTILDLINYEKKNNSNLYR